MLLEQPTRSGQAVQLARELPVVGRGMHEGRVWGFRSSVLLQTVQPFRILFLGYPKQIEEITLRKSERLHMKIQVVVSGRKHEFEEMAKDPEAPRGVLRNLSQGGASVACPYRFEVNMPLFISFELPNGKVVDNLMGFVRNVTREHNENIYGVQFHERTDGLQEIMDFVNLASKIVSRSRGGASAQGTKPEESRPVKGPPARR